MLLTKRSTLTHRFNLSFKCSDYPTALSPEVVDLSPSEIALAESERDFIENLGFEFEQFSQNAVVIRSFPVVTATLSPGLAFSCCLSNLISCLQRS